MPWSSGDAKHKTKKADTSKKQRQWKAVANSEKKSGKDDATAIKAANSVVGKNKNSGGKSNRAVKRSSTGKVTKKR